MLLYNNQTGKLFVLHKTSAQHRGFVNMHTHTHTHTDTLLAAKRADRFDPVYRENISV